MFISGIRYKTRWSCRWNSLHSCTQNFAKGAGGLEMGDRQCRGRGSRVEVWSGGLGVTGVWGWRVTSLVPFWFSISYLN